MDWDGLYPLGLAGGDPTWNGLSMDFFYATPGLAPGPFFDNKDFSGNPGADGQTDPEYCLRNQTVPSGAGPVVGRHVCMDNLLRQGYLAQYPTNPFVNKDVNGTWGAFTLWGSYGLPMAFGGYYGNLLWDQGWGRGEWPILTIWNSDPSGYWEMYGPPINNIPGNFYYHPYFCDGLVAASHSNALVDFTTLGPGMNNSDGRRIVSHAVCGYVLSGFGAVSTLGIDATHMSCYNSYFWGLFGWYGNLVQPTGYYSYEPDPIAQQIIWNPTFPNFVQGCNPSAKQARDEVGESGSGPDGRPDFLIVNLYAGLDKKVAEVTH